MEDKVVCSGESTIKGESELEFWRNLNRKCCDEETVISSGAWIEADKSFF